MKQRTQKTIGILALMYVSSLLLSILVYQWLRSQYHDEKKNLQTNLQIELDRTRKSVADSTLYTGIIKPFQKPKGTHIRDIDGDTVISISDHDAKKPATIRTQISSIKLHTQNISLPPKTKISISSEAKGTIHINSDAQKEAVINDGLAVIVNELIKLDSANADFDIFKIDTVALHAMFAKNLAGKGWDFTVRWYDHPDDALSIPSKNIFIKTKHYRATYYATVSNFDTYILKLLLPQMLFSLLLLSTVIFAFFATYRTLRQQMRLSVMKNDLISNMSHELKTPIATVQVALEALSNFNAIEDPQRTREYLHMASLEMNRLNLLVNQSLNNALLESGKIKLQKQAIDMNKTVSEVLQMLSLKTTQHNATINFEVIGENFTANADKLHIQGVLINLIDNSIKYTTGDPRINITLTDAGNAISIIVSDNGIGIPGEYLDKVFDKFFRVPAGDTHDVKGYGLGLSYAWQIIKQHGGSIAVESKSSSGTAFTITLPKH